MDVTGDDTALVCVDDRSRFTRFSLGTGEFIDGYRVDGELISTYRIVSSDHFALAVEAELGEEIYVYCFEQKRTIALRGHQSSVQSLACSYTNSHKVISGSLDDVKLWTLPSIDSLRGNVEGLAPSGKLTIECNATFVGHTDAVLSVAFCEDERWIVSGSRDGSVRFWDPIDGRLVLLLYGGAEGDGGKLDVNVPLMS